MGIGTNGRAGTIENLLSASTAFGLTKDAALTCIEQLSKEIGSWEEVFSRYGVSGTDIDMLRLVIAN